MKYANSQEELEDTKWGNPLQLPDMLPDEVHPFWIRVGIPDNTRIQDKRDMRIGVRGNAVLLELE